MKIETRFDLGQTVWAIRHQGVYRIIACEVCGKTGKITIGTEEFVCPKCNGKSAHPIWSGEKHYVSCHGIVGQVAPVYVDTRFCDYAKEPIQHNYMIDSTGVGSGQVWRENELFASREEAQAECDKRNGLLNLVDEAELQHALI
jgi:hypothetical protein